MEKLSIAIEERPEQAATQADYAWPGKKIPERQLASLRALRRLGVESRILQVCIARVCPPRRQYQTK
jgi:hypothetical protein